MSHSDAAGPGVSPPVAGVVLAGGQSRRLGRDKAVEPFWGQPLIRRVIDRVAPVTQEIVVVVADAARGQSLPLESRHRVAVDRYPGGGSLGGIFSGLAAARHPWALVVSCDMPFLNPSLLRHMLSLRQDADAVVPVVDGRPEPTHALYFKACLPHIEARIQAGELKISGFFDQVRVRYLAEDEVRRFDPEGLSFFNVNTPEDLARALALAAGPQQAAR
jgi:molybdopterin-guanine dinucleotide biosynthesis protein A